jgi:hypothetical protein
MNDAFLFIFGLMFIFFVWVYTGGPNRPISFAGPYITPITNVGQGQTGYGKGEKYRISTGSYDGNPRTGSYYTGTTGTETGSQTSGSGPESITHQRIAEINQQVQALQKFGTPSPYRGQVHIQNVSTSYQGQSNNNEYVTIASQQTTGGVDITGWRLVSEISGSSQTIPQGQPYPGDSSQQSSTRDIFFTAGQQARIYSGSPAVGGSYLENECSGYFRAASSNGYSYGSCPSPQSEFQKYYTGSASDYERCSSYIGSLQSCVTPPDARNSGSYSSASVPSSCVTFVNNTLTYSGCVANHHNDANFFGSTWNIYLAHPGVLWRQNSDTIKLLDKEGKTVDLYSY